MNNYSIRLAALALFLWVNPALAEQWKITLISISVQPNKADGLPWDGDNSAPDLIGTLILGNRISEKKCQELIRQSLPLWNNSLEVVPNISAIIDVPDNILPCIRITLWDRDILEPDLIGDSSFELQPDDFRVDVGKATCKISAEILSQQPNESLSITPPRPPTSDTIYKISIVSAEIEATRTDGAPWDDAAVQGGAMDPFAGKLIAVGLMGVGIPAPVAGFVGNAAMDNKQQGISHAARTAQAPDARLQIQWGDLTFSTPVYADSYSPSWESQVMAANDEVKGKPMRLELFDVDMDGEEPIGTDLIAYEDLTGNKIIKRSFGRVRQVLLQIETGNEESSPITAATHISQANTWLETGLHAIAGQTIGVSVQGEICFKSGPCVDGGGDAKLPANENGQVVVLVGNKWQTVGKTGSFVAQSSGSVKIGIATQALNSGAFDVTTSIFYPFTAKSAGKEEEVEQQLIFEKSKGDALDESTSTQQE